MRWLDAVRTRLRLLFSRGAAESRMEEEIGFHLEMEAERLAREEGLSSEEARRRARVTFGGVEKTKEELREGRGLAWLSGLRLDLKLGVRMLVKHPVLTGASVLSVMVAVALAASWFEFMTDMVVPKLPLDEADRIVLIRNYDREEGSQERRMLHDFEVWERELESVEELAAASTVDYRASTDDGRLETLEGARLTEGGFPFTRVDPLLGRALVAGDFEPDAPLVAVLGYDAWQRLYDGDRTAVGETLRLGTEYATVVGVMPEDFGFPVNQEVWTPFRADPAHFGRRDGPALSVFGRLAPGSGLEEAQAEIEAISRQLATAYPETHEHLRSEVSFFSISTGEEPIAVLLNIPFLLLLVVVSANVATLLLARTATRESELALRSALGASRRRIVLQLIAEALVLTMLAAGLGLAAAAWGLGWGMDLFWQVQQMRAPFFFDSRLSGTTVLYVLGLAVLGALIIGALPGLRATRRKVWNRLPQPGTGGTGLRFGRVATGVIVVQVALCVGFFPVAIMNAQELLPERGDDALPADRYLSGRLVHADDRAGGSGEPDATGADAAQRRAALFDEVGRRLAAEPGVTALTRASRIPGMNHPVRPAQVEGDSLTHYSRTLAVDPTYFDVVGVRVVAGRGFRTGDVSSDAAVVVVDREWARERLGGRSPVGLRLRFPDRESGEFGRWYEIVGVVAGMGRATGPAEQVGILQPLVPEQHASVHLLLRTDGPADPVAPRVQSAVAAIDPGLAIAELLPLDEVWRPVRRANIFFATALQVVGAIILLFALMGIYALTSFTVARRTREIGIRAALGARPGRIIFTIFSRAMGQIAFGVVAGAVLVSLTVARSPEALPLVAGVALGMLVVGMIGCTVPAARALRIQPTDALRAE